MLLHLSNFKMTYLFPLIYFLNLYILKDVHIASTTVYNHKLLPVIGIKNIYSSKHCVPSISVLNEKLGPFLFTVFRLAFAVYYVP